MSKFFTLFDLIFQQFVSYNKNPFRCFVIFGRLNFRRIYPCFLKQIFIKKGKRNLILFNFIVILNFVVYFKSTKKSYRNNTTYIFLQIFAVKLNSSNRHLEMNQRVRQINLPTEESQRENIQFNNLALGNREVRTSNLIEEKL